MTFSLKKRFQNIRTFIFDVDGVMTDNKVYAFDNGDLARAYNVRDGLAMASLIKLGYRVAVITGGKQPSIKTRLNGLGIQDVFLGVKTNEKINVFENYCQEHGLKESEILYMGDDLPDYHIMSRAVLACCPADAMKEIKQIAHFQSQYGGGQGAVREVIELTLSEQKRWFPSILAH